jgi:archaellin
MSRAYQFTFTIECGGDGTPDLARVEELIDLSMQDLVYDDEFISALDEQTSVTIQVTPNFGKRNG